jgi:hypothetical protein
MMTLDKSRVITADFHSCTRLTSINLCKVVAAVSAYTRSPSTLHRNTSTSWRRSRRRIALWVLTTRATGCLPPSLSGETLTPAFPASCAVNWVSAVATRFSYRATIGSVQIGRTNKTGEQDENALRRASGHRRRRVDNWACADCLGRSQRAADPRQRADKRQPRSCVAGGGTDTDAFWRGLDRSTLSPPLTTTIRLGRDCHCPALSAFCACGATLNELNSRLRAAEREH